jgi:threonine/homoserine/homoserine lactone efflux protein
MLSSGYRLRPPAATLTTPWLFFACILAVLLSPGPTNALLWTSGALRGVRASLPLLAGELCGYLLGIGSWRLLGEGLLKAAPQLGTALKLLVAGYLVFLAWQLWRRGNAPDAAPQTVGLRQVFTTTLLNPKGAVFAFGIFPHFEHWADALPYVAVFVATVPTIGSLWIGFGHFVRSSSLDTLTLRRIGAAVLCAAAGLVVGSLALG